MKSDGEKRSRCHRAMPASRNAGWQRVKVGRRKCSRHAEEGGGKCSSSSKAAEEKVGLGQLVRWAATCWDLCNQSNQRFRPRQISTTRPGCLCALRLCRRAHGDTSVQNYRLFCACVLQSGMASARQRLRPLYCGGWWLVTGTRCPTRQSRNSVRLPSAPVQRSSIISSCL
jgi:hypothetical protein